MKILRNAVAPRHIANLCGGGFTALDIIEVGDELGFERGYGLYERREARAIVAKLITRTSDPQLSERLRSAYKALADESEDDART